MTFPFRQRSQLIAPHADLIHDDHRSNIPFPALENVPQKHTHTHARKSSKNIITRVSSIFTPKKKRPLNLTLQSATSSPHLYADLNPRWLVPVHAYGSSSSLAESEDDIRRPSGLGRAASISSNRSMPPSPFTPAHDQNSPFNHHGDSGPGPYQRIRAISSPNLLHSITTKVDHTPFSRTRRVSSMVPRSPLTVVRSPPKRTPEMPTEVLVLVLANLPRATVALFATVSRAFTLAARNVLYTNLQVDDLAPVQMEKLIALLASRPDLTDLVRRFTVGSWPEFLPAVAASSSKSSDVEHRNALLTATFTLAFQRMAFLTNLTLPSFDRGLLAHHSAAGLRSLTLLNEHLPMEEAMALFTWLDGQTTVVELLFPCLMDVSDTNMDGDAQKCSPTHGHNFIIGNVNGNSDITRHSSLLNSFPSTPLASSGGSSPFTPSPSSAFPSFPANHSNSLPHLTPLLASPALLPNLQTLHASPNLLSTLLIKPMRFKSLRDVRVNINTTLYCGLRPSGFVGALSMGGGVERLVLEFWKGIDRRTMEKVLGAVGAGLCNKKGAWDGMGRTRVDEGLKNLEVVVLEGGMTTETVYKIVQTVLPRYEGLQEIRVRFADPHKRYSISTSTTTSSTSSKNSLNSKPKPNSLLKSSSGMKPRPPTRREVELDLDDKFLDVEEEMRMELWVKLCPSLKFVQLLSGAMWRSTDS